jgi:two-component system phosphate regulon sensor histidine kinase PhoR
MQQTSPKSIALTLAFALTALMLLPLALFKLTFTQQILWWELVILSLIVFFGSYFLVYRSVKKYIYDRVKVIYKSLHRQKGASDLAETDLEKVDKDVETLAALRQKEIEDLKLMETFRREFLGNVSHELKTPIFNIQGYIHTLLDGAIYDENVNMQYLDRTSKSVDRMINIVEDLEMISKIESDRLELEFTDWDIVEMTQEIFDQVEFKAKKRNVTLKFEQEYSPIRVHGDKDKMMQVMTNLIVNSIKYGKEGGSTELRFYEMGENMLVEVADDGIGISESNLPRLFERFYRVDKSRSREQGGTGLGLAIVKHIIEAHKQSINVRSTAGLGSTFSFTIAKSKRA